MLADRSGPSNIFVRTVPRCARADEKIIPIGYAWLRSEGEGGDLSDNKRSVIIIIIIIVIKRRRGQGEVQKTSLVKAKTWGENILFGERNSPQCVLRCACTLQQ